MPYCSQCGNRLNDADVFCAGCGKRQAGDAAPARGAGMLTRLSPRKASILCYVPWLGGIMCIVVLAVGKFRHDGVARFHAFQGLYLFVGYLVDELALPPLDPLIVPFLPISRLFEIVLLAASIFMMLKTLRGAPFSLPLLGDLAQRAAAENPSGK
jgi:uncharacterized membrane protein